MVTLPPYLGVHKNTGNLRYILLLPYELHNEVLYARLWRSNSDATICYLSHIINNIITAIRGHCLKQLGFSGGIRGKEPTCHRRRNKRCRFDPWVWKIHWSRKCHPTLVLLPGKPHRQRSLVGYSPWSHKESDLTDSTEHSLPKTQLTWLNSQ